MVLQNRQVGGSWYLYFFLGGGGGGSWSLNFQNVSYQFLSVQLSQPRRNVLHKNNTAGDFMVPKTKKN